VLLLTLAPSPPSRTLLQRASATARKWSDRLEFEERAVVNRQYKREMKKQEGKKRAPSPRPAAAQQKRQRTRPRQFAKEVIAELQKVNWPSRSEVVSYSTVVLVAAVALAVVIAGMDYVFTKGVLVLFGVD
jgi:preprotein translocase subunit SecE